MLLVLGWAAAQFFWYNPGFRRSGTKKIVRELAPLLELSITKVRLSLVAPGGAAALSTGAELLQAPIEKLNRSERTVLIMGCTWKLVLTATTSLQFEY